MSIANKKDKRWIMTSFAKLYQGYNQRSWPSQKKKNNTMASISLMKTYQLPICIFILEKNDRIKLFKIFSTQYFIIKDFQNHNSISRSSNFEFIFLIKFEHYNNQVLIVNDTYMYVLSICFIFKWQDSLSLPKFRSNANEHITDSYLHSDKWFDFLMYNIKFVLVAKKTPYNCYVFNYNVKGTPKRYNEKDFTTPNMYIYMLTPAINAQTKSMIAGHGIGKYLAKTKLEVDNGNVTHE
ncbi:hypothetical protein AGLY_000503 [Aphis glycines]|uniref:Uncharacterized protein n=1 Tax=Aphis glycines TaxID=307491 RepID=A0A6G0U872_APHGL|nr:hypothetical protein AGLY_000503 [Aphis glycines]